MYCIRIVSSDIPQHLNTALRSYDAKVTRCRFITNCTLKTLLLLLSVSLLLLLVLLLFLLLLLLLVFGVVVVVVVVVAAAAAEAATGILGASSL